MPKFDVKNYKVDTTPLSRINRLNTKHLSEVLTYWSRISNNRAKRMAKIDPMYSGLLYMEETGEFGKSGTFKDRATMIHELQRIKHIAPTLKKKDVEGERDVLQGIQEEVGEQIPLNTFRGAFAEFKKKHGYVPPDKRKKYIIYCIGEEKIRHSEEY